VLTADKFLIAVGTRPARREDIPFDGKTIFDSDQILWGGVDAVPKRLIVVGAGVIGMEYASMMSIIPGSEVTVIDGRKEILDMADKEVAEALKYAMRQSGTRFYTDETIKSVEKAANGEVIVKLNSGKTIIGDGLLYTVGRQGSTDGLNLAAVGLETDKRGLLQVDDNFRTSIPHMYVVMNVIRPLWARVTLTNLLWLQLCRWGLHWVPCVGVHVDGAGSLGIGPYAQRQADQQEAGHRRESAERSVLPADAHAVRRGLSVRYLHCA
jgi:hypothetical protein